MAGRYGYRDIVAHFQRLIEAGELAPGDRMPTMNQVVHDFHVSTMTANRAYRELKNLGLTSSIHGIGTIVAGAEQIHAPVQPEWLANAKTVELTRDEGRAVFDKRAQRLLGISGDAFLQRWDAGEYLGTDDPNVIAVAMLMPFAR